MNLDQYSAQNIVLREDHDINLLFTMLLPLDWSIMNLEILPFKDLTELDDGFLLTETVHPWLNLPNVTFVQL